MKNYIGIDLGTTNSAICVYDGENTKIFKSPTQHDVTPSAIYFDKRGNKYIGTKAYEQAARSPDNAATLFKRYMGTSTKIKLPAVNLELTPEECSSEILKTLYGYLPEEIRNSDDTGIIITVPAAFNQMQKDATMQAVQIANLGNVALMQEPVAAVMSAMRVSKNDGTFLVYDLGGGTLDIAIADSANKKVSLLSHGGIAMCGGRDFDTALFNNIVKPWLLQNFNLPEDITINPKYKTLHRMAVLAAEKAKIELSSKDEAIISSLETDINTQDLDGNDIYLDITLTRADFNPLIQAKLQESIHAAREIIENARLSAYDIERIVFVGGPTQYKPLRDQVSFELGIAASTDVNPMTAVAEGAAIFAESIDWNTEHRIRKSSRASVKTGSLDVSFNYFSRTPDNKTKIVAKVSSALAEKIEFQIDSLNTGWSSGKMKLTNGASLELPLSKNGENQFKIFAFDERGGLIFLKDDRVIITKTAATIDAIPASSSIGIEVKNKIGGESLIDYLVREGDRLPVRGTKSYRAEESLRAGSPNSLKFKIWEGDIKEPCTDNLYIGMFEINGTDFENGSIAAGAEITLDYEILDSGNIVLNVTIPSVGGSFRSGKNFYSRYSGQTDYTQASKLVENEFMKAMTRVEAMEEQIADKKLGEAKEKLNEALKLSQQHSNPEAAKQAMDNIEKAKKLLSKTRQENLKPMRQVELDMATKFFNDTLREKARPIDISKFENLVKTAQRAIDSNSDDFELSLREIKGLNFDVLWKHDWFVVEQFDRFAKNPYMFPNQAEYENLIAAGREALKNDDFSKLRQIVSMLYQVKNESSSDVHAYSSSNIVKG